MPVLSILGVIVGVMIAISGVVQEPRASLIMLGLIVLTPMILSYVFARWLGWFAGLAVGVLALVAGVWISTEIGSSFTNGEGPILSLIVLALFMIGGVIWWLSNTLAELTAKD